MLQTKFTELLGCTVPLQQAGMGKIASPALAAAVAEAGAGGEADCDRSVAQGTEAGGHVRGKIGLLALLSEVLPSVKVPVVAAAGIGTGRAMAAALAAGASAVRVGTRFVAAEEAGTHVKRATSPRSRFPDDGGTIGPRPSGSSP